MNSMTKNFEKLSTFHKGQILTEGLILVREDICDWINNLFDKQIITGDTFLTTLHDGVVLCDLIRRIYDYISTRLPYKWPKNPPVPDRKAKIGSFKAKDNISLFLNWCREIGLLNTILFETRGLTNSDEEKNIVLTLLHIGEVCVDFKMPLPEFAKFHQEMILSKSKLTHTTSVYALGDTSDLGSMESGSLSARSESNIFDAFDSELSVSTGHDSVDNSESIQQICPQITVSIDNQNPPNQTKQKRKPSKTQERIVDSTLEILNCAHLEQENIKEKHILGNKEVKYVKKINNFSNKNVKAVKCRVGGSKNDHELKKKLIRSKSRDSVVTIPETDSPIYHCHSNSSNIDLKIKEVRNRCQCHTKFLIEKTILQEGMYKIGNKNIFVRMFRGNIMLRVGGGWETLNEYLNKVDPCCKSDNVTNNAYQRRKSMATTTFVTDLTNDGMINKNLRKLSQCELTTVRKKSCN